jgi:hypothetical protein
VRLIRGIIKSSTRKEAFGGNRDVPEKLLKLSTKWDGGIIRFQVRNRRKVPCDPTAPRTATLKPFTFQA